MANRISKRVATDEEIIANGIKADYFEDTRSKNGFIRVGLKVSGTALINDSIEKSIMNKQKELDRLRKQHSAVEYVVDDAKEKERYIEMHVDKKKKKEKKEEKKKKKAMKNMSESTKLLMGAIDEYKETYIKTKKDKDDEDSFDGVRSFKKGVKKEEGDDETKEKRKAEAEEKEFNRRFDEPITLMKQNIIELDKTSKEIDELLAEAKESRAKGRSMMLKDLLGAKVGVYSNKTQAIGKLADMQKVRIELSLKKAKEEGPDLNQKNKDIVAISRAMPFLLASSSKKNNDDDDDDDRKKDKDKDKQKRWKDKKYDADDYEDKFDKHAANLIKSGKIELSPCEAAIEIEGKYTAAIKKSFKNQDWCVIALDKNGNEIKNFTEKYGKILPRRKNLDLRFDDERGVAKDKRTDQSFQVIMVPYI